ncbi:RNA polymerase sigma factor [Actinomadura chibensis]|uniref:RNA polymerase sigma factor n=1 Tax=Actinomadura chibensis TaxID=392828 RepID=A0A5D0NV56_9ACTN|nr:RNA polymerase sigma factor [Actinomadura chibensis]TYB48396.1 RNA polymerase sigma factor [Actinomadura chibensis]
MTTPSPSDAETIVGSWRRPEEFAAIFDRYYAEIHRYVDRRLGPDIADDIAAETFLVAFRSRGKFQPESGSARPWLYGIATRLVSRHRRTELRKYKAITRLQARVPVDEHEDDALTGSHTVDAPLSAALTRLKHGDRDVLLLIALGDLSYAEVAQALGIAYGTVCSRLNRARRQVKAELSDRAIASPDGGEIHA